MGCGVRNVVFEVWGMVYGLQGVGCGVWELECGVWVAGYMGLWLRDAPASAPSEAPRQVQGLRCWEWVWSWFGAGALWVEGWEYGRVATASPQTRFEVWGVGCRVVCGDRDI